MKFLMAFMVLFAPLLTWAQDVVAKIPEVVASPDSIEQALQIMPVIMELFHNGQYLAMSAGIVMILVFGIKKYLLKRLKLGNGVLPLISAGLGVAVALSLSIFMGANVQQACLAMLAGPAAGNLWDSVVKYFFKK